MTLTYIVVVIVVVAILYLAYRSLATSPTVGAGDYGGLLGRLSEVAAQRSGELAALIAGTGAPAGGPAGGVTAKPGEAAAAARKQLAAGLQQLAAIEPDAVEGWTERLSDARALLTTGLEDLAWACRLAESPSWPDNTGLRRAAEVLREHGDACLDGARSLLAAPDEARDSSV